MLTGSIDATSTLYLRATFCRFVGDYCELACDPPCSELHTSNHWLLTSSTLVMAFVTGRRSNGMSRDSGAGVASCSSCSRAFWAHVSVTPWIDIDLVDTGSSRAHKGFESFESVPLHRYMTNG